MNKNNEKSRKYKQYYCHFFFIYSFIFFSLIKKCKLIPNLEYPQSINLLNGNIFIIERKSISLYNSSFQFVRNILDIKEENIKSEDKMQKNALSQFPPEQYGYIISVINSHVYIFNYEGNFLYKNTTNINDDCSIYYELLPINSSKEELNYMIGYVDDCNNIHLNFYKYNLTENKTKISKIIAPFKYKYNGVEAAINDCQKFFTCNLMTTNNQTKISCFIPLNKPRYIVPFFIDPETYEVISSTETKYLDYSCSTSNKAVKSLRSLANKEKTKSFICFYIEDISGFCSIYSIDENIFNELKNYNLRCEDKYFATNLYYIRETRQYIFACVNNENKGNLTIYIFDDYFNVIESLSFPEHGSLKGFSIVFSNSSKKYHVISDSDNNCDNTKAINYIIDLNSTESFIENITSYIEGLHKSDTTNSPSLSPITTHISTTLEIPTTFLIDSTILSTQSIEPIMPNIISTSKSYISSSIPEKPSTEIIMTQYLETKKEDIISEIPNIMENIEEGQIYKKIGENYTILIYPIDSPYLKSFTHVNFEECEKILRENNQIDESSNITFLQFELENDNSKSLINQVEYQAYVDKNKILDLSLCKDADIQVFYSIKNNSLIDLDFAKNMQDSGFDVFNLNDSFFNDICQPYSVGDDDVILEDRIKYIYQNYSLCEDGCTYEKVDFENMTIACNCKVKENISTVLKPMHFNHAKGSSTNFDVIKCYNLVFSFEGKFNNIGFWILGILVIIHAPIFLFYFSKGIRPVKDYIINQMKKFGYIKDKKKKNKNGGVRIEEGHEENAPQGKQTKKKKMENLLLKI